MNIPAVRQALRGPALIERSEGVWIIEPLQFIPLHSKAVKIGSDVMFEVHARTPQETRAA